MPLTDNKNIDADALNERQKIILQEICDSFIMTGVPVGSRTLSKLSSLSCSPATIRNEMSDLEVMGYLAAPHASAGRLPTEKGYRFYVSCLMKYEKISNLEESIVTKLQSLAQREDLELEELLKQAVRFVCNQTGLAGLLLMPQMKSAALEHIKFFRILSDKLMVIMIDQLGNIDNTVVDIAPDITDEMLDRIVMLLNVKLCHQRNAKVEQGQINHIKQLLGKYNELLNALVAKIKESQQKAHTVRNPLLIDGFANILEQPEFSEPEKMKMLLQMLNQKEELLELLSNSLDQRPQIMVNIGTDSGLALNDMSLVTASYSGPNQSIGNIGVIGPLRMNYGQVVAILAQLSNALSRVFIGQH